ncbi:MAG: hypothetical protein GY722_20785 [bacterium]|nr:hypothetical protein [bacterium]
MSFLSTPGALTLVEVHDDNESSEMGGSPTEQTHLDGAIGVAISPDGNHVYVAAVFDSAVTVFSRNGGTEGRPTMASHLFLFRLQ